MSRFPAALRAALLAAAALLALVGPGIAGSPGFRPISGMLLPSRPEQAVLGSRLAPRDGPSDLRDELERRSISIRRALRTPAASPSATAVPPATPQPEPSPQWPVVTGRASSYSSTAGYDGQPVIALPGAMGGRYTGAIQGYATVCADRCARLAVVDWCDCYWGSADQRVVDISHAAWPLVSDQPLSRGIIEVRVILDDPHLAATWWGG
ncbi:MAG TPA: hypothetical protein VF013_02530 [Candidatus Limnocylindria bacterium]